MTLNPTGSGAYTGEVCPTCGSQVWILPGETPECLRCFTANETALMCAEMIGGGLNGLLKIVGDLPSDTKRTLHSDLLMWRVELEQALLRTQP